jgi:hypothetical protein
VTDVVKLYMEKQILSGIDVVQIFDSWAAAIEPSRYDEFSWSYMVEIAEYLKEKYPHIPVIMFPKGIPAFLDKVYGNFDVFGVDWSTPMALAKEKLGRSLRIARKYGTMPFVFQRANHRVCRSDPRDHGWSSPYLQPRSRDSPRCSG